VKDAFSGSAYKNRWFVLDRSTRTLKYYKDEISTEVNGWIDLSHIREIRYSIVADAPSFALDLVSNDVNYTVAGHSKVEILRWAVALSAYVDNNKTTVDAFQAHSSSVELVVNSHTDEALLGSGMISAVSSPSTADDSADSGKEWFRFDYTLKRDGPLRINVMGTVDRDEDDEVLSYWLIVSGFATGPNGEQAEAKLSGQVRPKDYIVGVNGEDITGMEFSLAMTTLKSAPMPRTLHFLRDLREQSTVFFEAWSWVYYESLNKRRKRYLELSSYALSFRKPNLHGGMNSVRDAYFLIDQIDVLRRIIDKTTNDGDQKFVLRLLCKRNSIVNFVGSDDMPVGGSIVEYIEICMGSREDLDRLCFVLANANERMDPLLHVVSTDIHLSDWETMVNNEDDDDSANRLFGLKSFITGTFALRLFELKDGNLLWKKPNVKGEAPGARNSKGKRSNARSLFIANSTKCGLKGVAAVVDKLEGNEAFRYQLILTGPDQTVTMGMPDEIMLVQWLDAVRELIEQSPDNTHDSWDVPDTITELDRAVVVKDSFSSVLLGDDDVNEDDEGNDESNVDSAGRTSASSSKKQNNVLARTMSIFSPGGMLPLSPITEKETLAGHMYYRHNTKTLWKKQYSRYYFVLRGMYLLFYKGSHGIGSSTNPELGRIELNSVLEIREARDPALPDNFLEIVTQDRIYAIGAESEIIAVHWLEAISDLLESRNTVNVKVNASTAGSLHKGALDMARPGQPDRKSPKIKKTKSFVAMISGKSDKRQQDKEMALQAKLDGIQFQGGLGIKCRSSSGAPLWKDKYFVITRGTLADFYLLGTDGGFSCRVVHCI
jgi:hypothetical protein